MPASSGPGRSEREGISLQELVGSSRIRRLGDGLVPVPGGDEDDRQFGQLVDALHQRDAVNPGQQQGQAATATRPSTGRPTSVPGGHRDPRQLRDTSPRPAARGLQGARGQSRHRRRRRERDARRGLYPRARRHRHTRVARAGRGRVPLVARPGHDRIDPHRYLSLYALRGERSVIGLGHGRLRRGRPQAGARQSSPSS